MTRQSIVLATVSAFAAAVIMPINLAAQTLDRTGAVGTTVRVIAKDGSRATGRLVSLSDTEVVVRLGRNEQRLALFGVERVERVRHHARNLAVWGALAGAVAGGLAGGTGDGQGTDTSQVAAGAAFFAGIGAGAGAGIGALIAVATRDGNVLYLPDASDAAVGQHFTDYVLWTFWYGVDGALVNSRPPSRIAASDMSRRRRAVCL